MRLGLLHATSSRAKEVFSFEYDREWLHSGGAQVLDPRLGLFEGPQFPDGEHPNFGLFLDSSPDRWGRLLMERREILEAKQAGRDRQRLMESDYLLGVYDGHRMGGLRFKLDPSGSFLDDNKGLASPPWTSIRELEYASLQIGRRDSEADSDYAVWLRMLIAPGASLGGARPKAGVLDPSGHPWIAKFPKSSDREDIGAWEWVAHQLALDSGINVAEAKLRRFNSEHHTFLTKRFDRTDGDERLHFASALTLLNRADGDSSSDGASYLEMAEILVRDGAATARDLEQLWRRIVFNICISNCDDHLRNHGFLLEREGWALSPAFDMNPNPFGNGLTLNISDEDNSQELDLAREVATFFRVSDKKAIQIMSEVTGAVRKWRATATEAGIPRSEIDAMERAFRATSEG